MENAIKKDMPEYYKKLKPYIDYLESLGFKSKELNKKYFKEVKVDGLTKIMFVI